MTVPSAKAAGLANTARSVSQRAITATRPGRSTASARSAAPKRMIGTASHAAAQLPSGDRIRRSVRPRNGMSVALRSGHCPRPPREIRRYARRRFHLRDADFHSYLGDLRAGRGMAVTAELSPWRGSPALRGRRPRCRSRSRWWGVWGVVRMPAATAFRCLTDCAAAPPGRLPHRSAGRASWPGGRPSHVAALSPSGRFCSQARLARADAMSTSRGDRSRWTPRCCA